MYRVRIEHSGYDERPFEFQYRYDMARFIEAIVEAQGLGDKITLTIEETKEDKDNG